MEPDFEFCRECHSARCCPSDGQIDAALDLVQGEDLQANGLLVQAELLSQHMRNALAAGRLSEALRAQERLEACTAAYARYADGDMAGLLPTD